jgi:hypothetical protein
MHTDTVADQAYNINSVHTTNYSNNINYIYTTDGSEGRHMKQSARGKILHKSNDTYYGTGKIKENMWYQIFRSRL